MTSNSSPTARSIKQLTIAIWAVAFALLAILIFWIISWVFPPPYISQFTGTTSSFQESSSESSILPLARFGNDELGTPFYELPIEQQIEQSSMIAVAEYEDGGDGRMRAMIREILKKDPGTVSYFDVGDEHHMSSYHGSSDRSRGDGVVIFFTGSPATMSLSMSYEGERIRSLGDMPLALFREKCSE